MNITGFVRKKVWGLSAVMISSLVIFSSCKKDKHEEPKASGSRSELTADSLFLFAKEVYFWNTSLPSYDAFSPRSYAGSDMEEGLNRELLALTKYAVNTSTGLSFEYNEDEPGEPKYSYVFNTNDANPIASVNPAKSSVDLEGHGNDIGLRVGYYGDVSNYNVQVQAVYPNSPAEKAGMSRGDVITSINNKTVGRDFSAEQSIFYNAFYTSGVDVILKGTKRTGGAFNLRLTGIPYQSSPIYKDSVYQAGAKKIGYLAYARFSNEADSKAALASVFDKFASAGVTDLILDLRYNGGGYVSTAQYLLNLIAPSSINGNTMFTEHYNELMQKGQAKILSKLPLRDDNDKIVTQGGRIVTYADQSYTVARNTYKFAKQGNLNAISNIAFIVTGNTASASELVINSLKPYFKDAKIVGKQTFGKPVGFFPIRIDKYDVYLASFETRNKDGNGGYYDGLAPDINAVDDPNYLMGDLREESLYRSYSYLKNGSMPVGVSSSKGSSVSSSDEKLEELESAKKALPNREFKGMIEDRFRAK